MPGAIFSPKPRYLTVEDALSVHELAHQVDELGFWFADDVEVIRHFTAGLVHHKMVSVMDQLDGTRFDKSIPHSDRQRVKCLTRQLWTLCRHIEGTYNLCEQDSI